MKSFFKFLSFALLALFLVVNFFPTHAHAAGPQPPPPYTLLAPLPLAGNSSVSNTADVNNYVKGAVTLAIGIAGALAVLRIIFGGIKYMTSEAFEGKSNAKETIQDAIIGLLLAISAYIILATVNPNLVNFQFNIKGLNAGAPFETSLGTTTPGEDTLGENITADCPIPGGGKQKCTCINCADGTDSGLTFKNNKTMEANLLKAMKEVHNNASFFGWRITEAWPPTPPGHHDPCHYNGRCVDVNLTDNQYSSGAPTQQQIAQLNTLANTIHYQGLGVIFEVNTANYNSLKVAGVEDWFLVDTSKSAVYDQNTAPSFHVSY